MAEVIVSTFGLTVKKERILGRITIEKEARSKMVHRLDEHETVALFGN